MPEQSEQMEAVSFGGWRGRRSQVEKQLDHPETRRELLRIEDDFHAGRMDRAEYQLEHLRLAGRVQLREQPLRRKFPSGRAVEAYAVAKSERQKIQPHTLAADGVQPFLRWYEPVVECFARLLETIRGLRAHGSGPVDEELVEQLIARGNETAAFYRDAKNVKEIPYLPPFQAREKRVGTDHEPADVLDVWEAVGGTRSQPQQGEWVPVQEGLL